MNGVYAAWLGRPVVLLLATEGMRVPLRGVITGECERAVKFCLDHGLDIDIYKEMILAVEEVSQTELADGMLCDMPFKAGARESRIVALE